MINSYVSLFEQAFETVNLKWPTFVSKPDVKKLTVFSMFILIILLSEKKKKILIAVNCYIYLKYH